MERRSFLKSTAAAGLVTSITATSVVNAFANKPVDLVKGSFANPVSTLGPFTWWHWMNGNIIKEGITMDLEAMKSVGLGGLPEEYEYTTSTFTGKFARLFRGGIKQLPD